MRIRPAVRVESTCPSRSGPCPLPNPVVAASGTFGHGDELADLCDPAQPRRGHHEVRRRVPVGGQRGTRRVTETAGGMLNSVGLPGPGVDVWMARDLPALEARGAHVIASIWGRSVDDYAAVAASLKGVADRIIALEVNLSCPNVEARRDVFAHSPDATLAAVTAVVDAVPDSLPVFAKLSPNVTDIVAIARAAVAAGAVGLTLVNTVMGLAIDTEYARTEARRGRRWVQRRADQAHRVPRGVGSRAGAARYADHRHGRRAHRTGRGRDAARGRARGRRRDRDVRGSACTAAHRDRSRTLVPRARRVPSPRSHRRPVSTMTTAMTTPDADVRSRLALALDVPDLDQAVAMARDLAPWFGVAKVGLELFCCGRPGRDRAHARARSRGVRGLEAPRHPHHRRARRARPRSLRRVVRELPRRGWCRHDARRARRPRRWRARRGAPGPGRAWRSPC